jgi:hypothetical protein
MMSNHNPIHDCKWRDHATVPSIFFLTPNVYRCADARHEWEVWVCHHILEILLHDFASPSPIQTATVVSATVNYVVWYIHLPVL